MTTTNMTTVLMATKVLIFYGDGIDHILDGAYIYLVPDPKQNYRCYKILDISVIPVSTVVNYNHNK